MAHEYTLSLKPDKKKNSPFKKIALTISANDNRGKGVRSFTNIFTPAPVVRAFNAYGQVPSGGAANGNSAAVGKYLK